MFRGVSTPHSPVSCYHIQTSSRGKAENDRSPRHCRQHSPGDGRTPRCRAHSRCCLYTGAGDCPGPVCRVDRVGCLERPSYHCWRHSRETVLQRCGSGIPSFLKGCRLVPLVQGGRCLTGALTLLAGQVWWGFHTGSQHPGVCHT